MTTKKLTTEQFVQKAREVHGDLYDYSLVEYKNCYTKVKITCRWHGVFEQIPNNHLKPQSCPHCANTIKGKAQGMVKAATAKSEFTAKATLIHNSKYDYSLVEYKNSRLKVKIICPIHGIFEQGPANHLQGQNCPHCSKEESGFTRTKFKEKCIKNNNDLGILYILGCWDDEKKETFLKIGITSLSIKKRYSSKASMPYNYKILHEIIGSPEYIYNLETLLHKKSKNYKYIPITSFGGSLTECFIANKDYLTKLNIYIFNLIPF